MFSYLSKSISQKKLKKVVNKDNQTTGRIIHKGRKEAL